MNALLRVAIVFAISGVCLAAAADKTMHVDASRDLRLAVVDVNKPSKVLDAQYVAFANSLGEAVSKQCGSTIGVRFKHVSADNAAFNLGTGVYDAVLVVTGTLPRALMISDVSRLSAVLGAGKNERKLYLIFGNSDTGLSDLLTASFAVALNNPKFLDTLNDPDSRATPAGEKLASATP